MYHTEMKPPSGHQGFWPGLAYYYRVFCRQQAQNASGQAQKHTQWYGNIPNGTETYPGTETYLMGALTHWVCFLYFKRTADILAHRLSVVFPWLVRLGSLPACWRQANVTPISKGPPSSSVANYRPISIRSVLSKVFERLVSVRLGRFMEHSAWCASNHPVLIGKVWVPVVHFCACRIHCKVH